MIARASVAAHCWASGRSRGVGARRAEEAPDQQEECKHTEYPDNQSLRVLGFEGRGESGQVERIKEGQRGTDQPEKSIGQVFLTQGSA